MFGLTFNAQDYDTDDTDDVVEFYGKVPTDFDFNSDGTVKASGETSFRIKINVNSGIFSHLVETGTSDRVYRSNVEDADIIASGVDSNLRKLFFVSDKCFPGRYKNGESCTECESSYYSNTFDVANCDLCSGIVNSAKTRCTFPSSNCAAGEFWNVSVGDCFECPVGQYQNETGQFFECKQCNADANTYQDETGQSSCKTCPAGNGVNADRTSCTTCVVNMFSVKGEECQECPNGQKQDLEGQNECVDIGDGPTPLQVGLGVGLGVGIPLMLIAVLFVACAAAVTKGIVVFRRRDQNVKSDDGKMRSSVGDEGVGIPLEEVSVAAESETPAATLGTTQNEESCSGGEDTPLEEVSVVTESVVG